MATLNPTNATQAVHHAAVQLAALDWLDQEGSFAGEGEILR